MSGEGEGGAPPPEEQANTAQKKPEKEVTEQQQKPPKEAVSEDPQLNAVVFPQDNGQEGWLPADPNIVEAALKKLAETGELHGSQEGSESSMNASDDKGDDENQPEETPKVVPVSVETSSNTESDVDKVPPEEAQPDESTMSSDDSQTIPEDSTQSDPPPQEEQSSQESPEATPVHPNEEPSTADASEEPEEEKKEEVEEETSEENEEDIENKDETETQQEKETKETPDEFSSKDFYARLGVPPTATKEEIQKAYHKLTREFHPDKNPSPDDLEKFKAMSEAYQQLKNEKTREDYDNILSAASRQNVDLSGTSISDLLDFINTRLGEMPLSNVNLSNLIFQLREEQRQQQEKPEDTEEPDTETTDEREDAEENQQDSDDEPKPDEDEADTAEEEESEDEEKDPNAKMYESVITSEESRAVLEAAGVAEDVMEVIRIRTIDPETLTDDEFYTLREELHTRAKKIHEIAQDNEDVRRILEESSQENANLYAEIEGIALYDSEEATQDRAQTLYDMVVSEEEHAVFEAAGLTEDIKSFLQMRVEVENGDMPDEEKKQKMGEVSEKIRKIYDIAQTNEEVKKVLVERGVYHEIEGLVKSMEEAKKDGEKASDEKAKDEVDTIRELNTIIKGKMKEADQLRKDLEENPDDEDKRRRLEKLNEELKEDQKKLDKIRSNTPMMRKLLADRPLVYYTLIATTAVLVLYCGLLSTLPTGRK